MRNFAAIDFETANGKRTSVCSVGVVIVKDGKIVNKIYRQMCIRDRHQALFLMIKFNVCVNMTEGYLT